MTPHSPSDTWFVILTAGIILLALALTVLAVYSTLMLVGLTAIRHIKKISVASGICSALMTVIVGAGAFMLLTGAQHPFGGLGIIVPVGLLVGLLSAAKIFGILRLTQETHHWIDRQARKREQK